MQPLVESVLIVLNTKADWNPIALVVRHLSEGERIYSKPQHNIGMTLLGVSFEGANGTINVIARTHRRA